MVAGRSYSNEEPVETIRRSSIVPLLVIILTLAGLLATGCAKKEEPPPGMRAAADSASPHPSGEAGARQDAARNTRQKLKVTINVSMEVKDLSHAFAALRVLSTKAGGYNIEESQNLHDYGRHAKVTMRIPPGAVDGTLNEIQKLGKVLRENRVGEDVTDPYYDLEARLSNAKAAETRLLNILRTKATKVSDIIEVEKELTRVRGDIESMTASKRTMDIETSMVLLVVDLSEPQPATPVGRKVWEPIRTAFGSSAEVFAYSIRFVIFAIVGVIPWTVLGWLLLRLRRRVKESKAREAKPNLLPAEKG